MVFYVIVVTILMILLTNKFKSIVMDNSFIHWSILYLLLSPTLRAIACGHPEHQPDSCAIKPSIRPNFINYCGPKLLTCI